IRFSRPTPVPVKIDVVITPKVGSTYNTSNLIKKTLVDWFNREIKVGDEVIGSLLYSPLNEIGGFAINDILLSRDPYTDKTSVLPVMFYERASIDAADIRVVQI